MASFNAANYFVSQCFRAPSHPDHIPLHKVEDLFSGDPTMIACLCTLLFKRWNKVHKSNPNENFLQKILGIVKRNKLMENKAKQPAALQDFLNQVANVQYKPQTDPQVTDHFGPIKENSLNMSSSINLHFIGSEADIPLLDRLQGAPMIGMDSEWRPTVKPFAE